MKRVVIVLLFVFLISGCVQKPQMANPASVYCEENWGKLEIKTAADGSQTGYCKFENGRECEEWAYYRKECSKEAPIVEGAETSKAKTYDFYIKGIVRDNTSALCSIVVKLTNINSVTHRYLILSSIKLNGVKAESTGEEFDLAAGKSRMTAHIFECPDNKEYELNSEASEV